MNSNVCRLSILLGISIDLATESGRYSVNGREKRSREICRLLCVTGPMKSFSRRISSISGLKTLSIKHSMPRVYSVSRSETCSYQALSTGISLLWLSVAPDWTDGRCGSFMTESNTMITTQVSVPLSQELDTVMLELFVLQSKTLIFCNVESRGFSVIQNCKARVLGGSVNLGKYDRESSNSVYRRF